MIPLSLDPNGERATMKTIIFFRAGHFYFTEYPEDYSDWAAEAERNPGTIRIEDMAGNVLWQMH